MEPYYLELAVKSSIVPGLLKVCTRDNDWFRLAETGGTIIKKTPHRLLLEQDPFLVAHILPRMPRIQWEAVASIFLMEPYTHYTMHTDGHRGASVNLLINPEVDSHCYFKSSEEVRYSYNICPLDYKHNCYYLFNSGKPHAITNLGQPRYLLSLSLGRSWQDHLDLKMITS